MQDQLPKPLDSVRIVTHNLWGQHGDWDARRSVLAGGLKQLSPDLVAFQEAITTDEYDQTVDLLGGDYHVVHQQEREPNGQGIAVASRWPVTSVREIDLNVTPRTADFACGTLIIEIAAPDPIGPMLFINHLPNWQPSFEHERQLQAVRVVRKVEEMVSEHGMPVVLAGDLDADPNATSIRFWTGRAALGGMSVCYRDAWECVHPEEHGETFTPRNPLSERDWPFRRIDYILVRWDDHGPGLNVSGCERVFDHPVNGIWASDHFGLMADLTAPF